MIRQGRRIIAFLCALMLALPLPAFAEQLTTQSNEKHSSLEEQLIINPVPRSDPMRQPTPQPTSEPRSTHPVQSTQKPNPRPTPLPTRTARPTLIVPSANPKPTATQEPTAAPTPTPTPTPMPTPTPSPTATPQETAVVTIAPTATLAVTPLPTSTPIPIVASEPVPTMPIVPGSNSSLESMPLDVDEAEQELYDPELFDAPVPKEAYSKRLYILDRVKELMPSENWSDNMNYGIGGLRIPLLYQYDYRKVVCFYYGRPKSVATSGCGAASMSMVIAYLTGNTEQTPYTLFRWAVNNNLYDGTGLSHEALIEIGAHYGVSGEWITRNKKTLKAALEQGIPVIAHMGRGVFTTQGHYIVLRGITSDGFVLVNDPNSWLHSALPFTLDDILKQTRTSDPFLLCKRIEKPAEGP